MSYSVLKSNFCPTIRFSEQRRRSHGFRGELSKGGGGGCVGLGAAFCCACVKRLTVIFSKGQSHCRGLWNFKCFSQVIFLLLFFFLLNICPWQCKSPSNPKTKLGQIYKARDMATEKQELGGGCGAMRCGEGETRRRKMIKQQPETRGGGLGRGRGNSTGRRRLAKIRIAR